MHATQAPSDWVRRWSHLVAPGQPVLDVACGAGRHMQWFRGRGHPVTGIDRSAQDLATAAQWGEALCADLENGPWPCPGRQFAGVVVTNYLWRPLFPALIQGLGAGAVLICETFAAGNETVGRPARPEFLLQPGELLRLCAGLRVIGFEDGFMDQPERFVQRIAAVRSAGGAQPPRYRL